MFVRVKDRDTRHEFDVPEEDPRIGVSLLKVKPSRYPPTDRPRRPKYYILPARANQKEVADHG